MATSKKNAPKKSVKRNYAADAVEELAKHLVKVRREDSPIKKVWAKIKVSRPSANVIRATGPYGDSVTFEFEPEHFVYVKKDDTVAVPYSSMYYTEKYGLDALRDRELAQDFVNEDLEGYIYESLDALAGEPQWVPQPVKAKTAKKPWWKIWL